jgi:hypothetical protein
MPKNQLRDSESELKLVGDQEDYLPGQKLPVKACPGSVETG